MHLTNRRACGLVSALAAATVGASAAEPDPDCHRQEARHLSNIRQVTFESMGIGSVGEAYFSPDDSMIIFQAGPDQEHYQIYTLKLEPGARPRMVSTGRGTCTCAYFHPTLPKIMFASTHLGVDRRHHKPEPGVVETPRYQRSTGGRYRWNFDPDMDIFIADLDGGNLQRLTDTPGYDAECAWGPDGRHIVFASNRTGDMEIYIMDADGSNVRRLTHRPGYDGGPFISPDGKRIIFRGDPRGDDHLQIFMMNIDGTNEVQLTDNDAVNFAPYWHPDGRHVIFATSLHGHYNYELYLIDVETRQLERITYCPSQDVLPVFSHDGRKIMWTSKGRGEAKTSQVFIADFRF